MVQKKSKKNSFFKSPSLGKVAETLVSAGRGKKSVLTHP